METKQQKFSIGYFIAVLIVLFVLQSVLFAPHTEIVPGQQPEAIDRVVVRLERKSRVINPKEKEILAYHEAGHALVAESREHADRVAKISLIPRGVAALGYTQQKATEDRYLMTRAELLDRLDVLLGGRAAPDRRGDRAVPEDGPRASSRHAHGRTRGAHVAGEDADREEVVSKPDLDALLTSAKGTAAA